MNWEAQRRSVEACGGARSGDWFEKTQELRVESGRVSERKVVRPECQHWSLRRSR